MTKTIFPAQSSKVGVKKRTALIGQGQRMSNWLFNIKQDRSLPERIRQEAELLQKAWDEISST